MSFFKTLLFGWVRLGASICSKIDKHEQTVAEGCSFSESIKPRLFSQGFCSHRSADFKKTSKRLQSGALFEDNAAFTPRSRRDRSRCGEDGPTCSKIIRLKTFCFRCFLKTYFHKRPKTFKTLWFRYVLMVMSSYLASV